jgi:hypothetical protein
MTDAEMGFSLLIVPGGTFRLTPLWATSFQPLSGLSFGSSYQISMTPSLSLGSVLVGVDVTPYGAHPP